MNCTYCKWLGVQRQGWGRCHNLPEALMGGSAIKAVRIRYHAPPEHPCPYFEPKT